MTESPNTPDAREPFDPDIDVDAERAVDDDEAEADEVGDTVDIPIETPIEDAIDQHTTVRFDDESHPDGG